MFGAAGETYVLRHDRELSAPPTCPEGAADRARGCARLNGLVYGSNDLPVTPCFIPLQKTGELHRLHSPAVAQVTGAPVSNS